MNASRPAQTIGVPKSRRTSGRLGSPSLVATILLAASVLLMLPGRSRAAEPDGVFVRFKLLEPASASYYIQFYGYIHSPNWYLPNAVFPDGADKDAKKRFAAGTYTEWFDVKAWAGKGLHGKMSRSGGVAEFPNVSVTFVTDEKAGPPGRKVVIELATAADEKSIVKRFDESFTGERTTFLVSPTLAKDKDELETLTQMQQRHLKWAREASGGQRVAPKSLIIQTGFYGFTMEGAEVLHLLGFTVLDGPPEMYAKYPDIRKPGHTHDVDFSLGATREGIDALLKRQADRYKDLKGEGIPFGFSDEICCRPEIGKDPKAIAAFHAWLAAKNIAPKDLGVEKLTDVAPIEDPKALQERQQANPAAANRVFYYTCRFRQEAGAERVKWNTEAVHKFYPPGLATTTLVADHPYFGGTGLGMGLVTSNSAWGGYPLALDWFGIAREKAVDMAGIEDWMGLQYMYGPHYTWEGFQLMGFQTAIFRSGSEGTMPIISWITPSDETNLRLKSASSLAQGAKNFFYWTWGPTCFGTENYWSDLKGEYFGIAAVARQLAAAEHIIAPGHVRKTRVALLYSISSDLWQPFGYIHMLERRATYLSLVHEQYLVDMLTEQDVEAGRLKDYSVLYVTDACITTPAAETISEWVKGGGRLYGSCAAGSRNEFNEPAPGLSKVFGIAPEIKTEAQKGPYNVRGGLNGLEFLDRIALSKSDELGEAAEFGTLGVKVACTPAAGSRVVGKLGKDGPAVVMNHFGKGLAVYFAGCPGLSYLKDAKFVAPELKEQYPATQRRAINALAFESGAPRLVELSSPVVEAGIYDSDKGTALVLGNFTYKPIDNLVVRMPVAVKVTSVRSVENGALKFTLIDAPKPLKDAGFAKLAVFTTKLGISDIVVLE